MGWTNRYPGENLRKDGGKPWNTDQVSRSEHDLLSWWIFHGTPRVCFLMFSGDPMKMKSHETNRENLAMSQESTVGLDLINGITVPCLI